MVWLTSFFFFLPTSRSSKVVHYLKAQFTLICTVINNPYKVPDHSADVAAA